MEPKTAAHANEARVAEAERIRRENKKVELELCRQQQVPDDDAASINVDDCPDADLQAGDCDGNPIFDNCGRTIIYRQVWSVLPQAPDRKAGEMRVRGSDGLLVQVPAPTVQIMADLLMEVAREGQVPVGKSRSFKLPDSATAKRVLAMTKQQRENNVSRNDGSGLMPVANTQR